MLNGIRTPLLANRLFHYIVRLKKLMFSKASLQELYFCVVKKEKCTPTFCLYGGVCKEPEDPTKPPFCICKTNKFVPPRCGM